MKLRYLVSSLFGEKKCYACGQVGHFFCQSCHDELFIYKPYCYVCKKESESFLVHEHCQKYFPLQQVIVLTRYRQNPVKRALRHAKYYGKFSLYEDLLPGLLKNSRIEDICQKGIFIPVPMNFFRKWKRGYNQTDKIARVLSNVLNLPVDLKLLSRTRITKHQSHLSQSERLKNLSGAFNIHKHSYHLDTPLYLVDDVVSTGATLCEIALMLQKEGFTDIRAIVIASD